MKKHYNNILETIGNTPLVKLNRIVSEIPATILAKIESTNPGNSVKDRMALKMIEDAEAKGLLKPGGTIIESTSGNTGMGLALVAIVKGYKAIFTTTDKSSKEKVDVLRAHGAEVIVCPGSVGRKDPQSYYSVAERLSKEIPNAYWCNQYQNKSNGQAHYESTGPEIWEQTEGKITHFITGVGTGGTISGIGRYLKEQNPNIKIWGIDSYGSVFQKYHETGIIDPKESYSYTLEGIGKSYLPGNVDFKTIDHFEKVTDKDAALGARKLVQMEGIFAGFSSGAAVMGLKQMGHLFSKDDLVVVLLHDHGSRYVGKIFNDDWMREHGFLDEELTVKDIIAQNRNKSFLTLHINQSIIEAMTLMKEKDISQMPIVDDQDQIVGSITENSILNALLDDPIQNGDKPIFEFMGPALPVVDETFSIKNIGQFFNQKHPAVIAIDKAGVRHIISQYNLIQTLG